MVEARREEDGKFPTYAWPGGYTIYYLMADNEVLCPDCANLPEAYTTREKREAQKSGADRDDPRDFTDRQWEIVAVDTHDEGLPLNCANCNKELPSSYGPTDYDYEDMIKDHFRQITGHEPNSTVLESCLGYVRDKDTEQEGHFGQVGEWVREFIDDQMGDNQGVAGRRQKIRNPITYEGNSMGHYLVKSVDGKHELYIQSDWDFPGLAETFGWNGKILPMTKLRAVRIDPKDEASAQIYSAIQYLDKNEGKVVEDPGYWDGEEVGRKQSKSPTILAVYDAPGFADRYSIYVDEKHVREGKLYDVLTLSDNCNSPNGVNMWASGMLGDHNGKKITFDQLPPQVQECARARLEQ